MTRRAAIVLALAVAAPGVAEDVIWHPAPVVPAAKFGLPQRVAFEGPELAPLPRPLPVAVADPVAPRGPAPNRVIRTQFAIERDPPATPKPVVTPPRPTPLLNTATVRPPKWITEISHRPPAASRFVPREDPRPSPPPAEPAARIVVPKP